MYTAPKSVGCSTVHQTYVVFFISTLIIIQHTDIISNEAKQLKQRSLKPYELIGNLLRKIKRLIIGGCYFFPPNTNFNLDFRRTP